MTTNSDTVSDAATPEHVTSRAHRRVEVDRPRAWVLALIATGLVICIALVTLAYHQARTSTGYEHFTVFWLGMLALVAASVVAGLRLPATGWMPVAMLLAIGLITYLPKILMSPSHPIYFDEYAQLRHAQDVQASGNIGARTDLLPVIQFYPGLSVLTLGVHYVSGLDLWHAGLIVIGLAHCASLLLVRALARAVGMSSRWAFFAALVFAANPGFMYFDSQYAYESLAIPLLLGAALCAVRARTASTSAAAWRFAAGGVVLAAATVVTHHVTSAMMAGLCLLVAIFLPTRATSGADSDHSLRRAQYVGTWVVAGFALISSGLWNLAISSRTRSYVLPSLTGGIHQLFDRITGSSPSTSSSDSATQNGNVSSHTPFSGSGVPSYEQVFAYAVPVLVVIGLLYSLWTIWRGPERWAQLRRSAPFLVFTVAYLGSLPLALTATGNQAAHRSWPFLFIGVGIFAIWGVALRAQGWSERRGAGPGIVVALVAVFISLNIGDISSGVNTAYRFPGPYTFGSDNRFNTAELSSLVTWADNHLATPGKVITDRFTAQPLVVGTRLGVPTNQESFANTLFKNPQEPSLELRTYLRHHGFRYFILDRRILTELPAQLFYQGYPGRRNLDLQVLGNLRNSTFIHEVHATKHYGVYVINP